MNLRKDHCRTLHSRTTRELVNKPRGAGDACALRYPMSGACARAHAARQTTYPRRGPRQGIETKRRVPSAPFAGLGWHNGLPMYTKRLSATDISALASMKNVAKCDTWCELQNPVNHRVFERKLRPKPLGRGHACLGVTRSVAPQPQTLDGPGCLRCGYWPPVGSFSRLA